MRCLYVYISCKRLTSCEANSVCRSLLCDFFYWTSTHFSASISVRTFVSFIFFYWNWWKLWTVRIIWKKFAHKRTRVFCLRFNKVCWELLSYLKSVGHIINILFITSLARSVWGKIDLYIVYGLIRSFLLWLKIKNQLFLRKMRMQWDTWLLIISSQTDFIWIKIFEGKYCVVITLPSGIFP